MGVLDMFTPEELDLLAAALEQLDVYHSNLARSIPALTLSGTIDEARGKCFLLLAKVRRSKQKAQGPVGVE